MIQVCDIKKVDPANKCGVTEKVGARVTEKAEAEMIQYNRDGGSGPPWRCMVIYLFAVQVDEAPAVFFYFVKGFVCGSVQSFKVLIVLGI